MKEKRALYFEAGAEEVWIVVEDGTVAFYSERRPVRSSVLAPEFPSTLPDPV
jgi:hypothetical protein